MFILIASCKGHIRASLVFVDSASVVLLMRFTVLYGILFYFVVLGLTFFYICVNYSPLPSRTISVFISGGYFLFHIAEEMKI
jgi:hypothetical protein